MASFEAGRIEQCRGKAHIEFFSHPNNALSLRRLHVRIRHRIAMSYVQRSPFMPPMVWTTTRSPRASTPPGRSSANGASDSSRRASRASKSDLDAGGQPAFPPRIVIAVKALACQLPRALGLPLSRFSISEIRRQVLARGLLASIGEPPPSGGGSPRTRFALGLTVHGYSRAIPPSRRRQEKCWTCTRDSGKDSR